MRFTHREKLYSSVAVCSVSDERVNNSLVLGKSQQLDSPLPSAQQAPVESAQHDPVAPTGDTEWHEPHLSESILEAPTPTSAPAPTSNKVVKVFLLIMAKISG
ncbi:MAG: hypothetical protein ABL921_16640 [Pirellula sp.]